MTISTSCPQCNAALLEEDRFCASCGAEIPAPPPAAAADANAEAAAEAGAEDIASTASIEEPAPPPPPLKSIFDDSLSRQPPMRFSGSDNPVLLEHQRKARQWLMAVAILTGVAGFILFGLSPTYEDPELAALARAEARFVLISNLVLSAFYLGMWFWAKRNLLGATITSLVIYAALFMLNAALDPTTIFHGIFIKIFFTAALVNAIREALADRAAKGTA